MSPRTEHQDVEFQTKMRGIVDAIVVGHFPTAKPTSNDITMFYKRALGDKGAVKLEFLPDLVKALAVHLQCVYVQLDKATATVAAMEARASVVDQLSVDVSDLKEHKATMAASEAEAVRRQAATDAALASAQAMLAEVKQTMATGPGVALHTHAWGRESAGHGDAWRQVGRGGRVQPLVTQQRLFEVRVEAVRGMGKTIPGLEGQADELSQALAVGVRYNNSHIHGGYIQPGKGGEPVAVVLKVTPGLAMALMKESRKPISEQVEVMHGWRVKRHMQATELRCVKAIWEEFGALLNAAKSSNVLYKYINNYTAVQIGDTTHHMREDNMPATQA